MPQEMMDSSQYWKFLAKYQYIDMTKRDIGTAINQYKNLFLNRDTYVFSDGTKKELAYLEGTIPVKYRNAIYHIPICIWLQDTHPYNSPMCYVKPTPDMMIRASRHVDNNGRVYLPYLHNWNPDSSDLLGLIQVMIIIFGEIPPVFSKPKQNTTTPQPPPPYPVLKSSSYMPMPGVGNPYPNYSVPYPTTTNMPYPPQQQQYPTGRYPPPDYSQYPPSTGAASNNMGYPAMPSATGGFMPQPPTNASVQQNSTGTISEEHIHASLLSAVEDKLKKRLREVLAQSQAEIEVLKKTQDDLTKGKDKLEDMLSRLGTEQVELQKNINILKNKEEEMNDLLGKVENQEELDIDEAVVTTAPLFKQLLQTFAEENATEDAIYYLGEALRKGSIDLDLFLKHARQLSRKQFMLRALMQKCRQKAKLPH